MTVCFLLFGVLGNDTNLLIQPKFRTHNLLDKRTCLPCEIVDDGSCNVFLKTHGDLVNNINNETIVVVVGDGVYFIPKNHGEIQPLDELNNTKAPNHGGVCCSKKKIQ
jgi:hypothetical protein